MVPFDLPKSSVVGQTIPKKAFHDHLTPAQKKTLTKGVEKITWTHKLSTATTNLEAVDIEEIQIFHIALRELNDLAPLCTAMEKVIPYTLILWLEFEGQAMISSSQKHLHAIRLNTAVVDWSFSTDWFPIEDCPFQLDLIETIDETAKRFWIQLSGKSYDQNTSTSRLVEEEQHRYRLNQNIKKLQASIARERQFNRKVELNQQLQTAIRDLKRLG